MKVVIMGNVQMAGRGTRIYPGKKDCLILDVVGIASQHNLITTANLFDLKPGELETKPISQVIRERDEAIQQRLPLQARGTLHATDVDLFRDRIFHWVPGGNGRFALAAGDGVVYLEPTPGELWRVRLKKRSGERETLRDGLDLGYAQGVAEDYGRRARSSWRCYGRRASGLGLGSRRGKRRI